MGDKGQWEFDADEAIALLPAQERIHTFLGFVGADWNRGDLEERIREAGGASRTGPVASSMGHGLWTEHYRSDAPLMFESVELPGPVRRAPTEKPDESEGPLRPADPGMPLVEWPRAWLLRRIQEWGNEITALRARLREAEPSVLQDDVRDLLEALGIAHYARPVSPHRVVQDEVLPLIRAQRAEAERLRGLLEWIEDWATKAKYPALAARIREALDDG